MTYLRVPGIRTSWGRDVGIILLNKILLKTWRSDGWNEQHTVNTTSRDSAALPWAYKGSVFTISFALSRQREEARTYRVGWIPCIWRAVWTRKIQFVLSVVQILTQWLLSYRQLLIASKPQCSRLWNGDEIGCHLSNPSYVTWIKNPSPGLYLLCDLGQMA